MISKIDWIKDAAEAILMLKEAEYKIESDEESLIKSINEALKTYLLKQFTD